MSRGFDGFEIHDFQGPERGVNRSPESNSRTGWDAVRRLESVESCIPLSCRCDQKRRESRKSKSSGKKNPGNEPRNDPAQGKTPDNQTCETSEPHEAHGDLFLDHDPDVVRMVELLEGVGIDLEVLLVHSLKHPWKAELIPNV